MRSIAWIVYGTLLWISVIGEATPVSEKKSLASQGVTSLTLAIGRNIWRVHIETREFDSKKEPGINITYFAGYRQGRTKLIVMDNLNLFLGTKKILDQNLYVYIANLHSVELRGDVNDGKLVLLGGDGPAEYSVIYSFDKEGVKRVERLRKGEKTVIPQGVTHLTLVSPAGVWRAEIETREIDPKQNPNINMKNFWGNWDPTSKASIVYDLRLFLDKDELGVNPSAFAFVSRLNKVELKTKGEEAELFLEGGDGAYGYHLKLNVDKEGVKRKRVSGIGSDEQNPDEDTTYRYPVLD